MTAILLPILLLMLTQQDISCEREHKVHNIVLYPEKHSWCQTTPIQQVVASPGFKAVTIQNNVCVGACFSYSIPKSEPAEPGELIGPYCDSCQPSEIECYHVNLHADNNLDDSKILQKKVQIIMNCSCQSCDKIRPDDYAINATNTQELPKHLYVDQEQFKPTEDVIHPDLFEDQNTQSKQHFEHDIKLKDKFKKWFEQIQNEIAEHKNTELEDLNKSLNDIQKENEKIRKDLEGLPKSFGLEGAPSHHKGAHIGMGIVHHPNDVADVDSTKSVDHKVGHHGHHGHHNHHHTENENRSDNSAHHHYLGEEQQIGTNLERLVKGPHGSMVAAPTDVKLHVDSDSLKPNDEGLVVEYENHNRDTDHKVAEIIQGV
ncbi:uncharacterized protein LOC115888658 [Sitophilus oryzae]|uniref:Uncharacterized protein LOC115888658 n=1 Tax=Sitophilus oryzae TaxID=7048 RepID=A0A6J2YLW6_SITOR|nr:uncharacterized protein LOC115888658 [Sitophilus oryzae]